MTGFGTELEDVECGYDGCQTDGLENRACFPIFVSPNDTDFGHRKRCLMFVRSQEAPNEDCVPGTARIFVFLLAETFSNSIPLFHVAKREDDIVICALCTAARNSRLSLSTTSLS